MLSKIILDADKNKSYHAFVLHAFKNQKEENPNMDLAQSRIK